MILKLAFQSIGVVYGDIGTSPLYVYASTFSDGIKHKDDILGVLSIIFYTITLIPVIKYVVIVLRANDNGNGTSFFYALVYSLINLSFIDIIISDYLNINFISNNWSKLTNVAYYHSGTEPTCFHPSTKRKFKILM